MVAKQYNGKGEDIIEVVIPPQDPETEAEYTIQAHLSFLVSNWTCLYGNGCPGMFGANDSTYSDDGGCCVDSFYLSDKQDRKHVEKQIAKLQPEDWDAELRADYEKNGWREKAILGDDEEKRWKGRVVDGACIFQNRNNGSRGKPGCAFVAMAAREGLDHIDVMPEVCWMLPLRWDDTGNNVWRLGPWDVSEWHTGGDFTFRDHRFTCAWWCIDSPDAYVGKDPVYKHMKRELERLIGEWAYGHLVQAIELRINAGNYIAPMPGSVTNEGRPLLPLAIGNRTPAREPSYMPDHNKAVIAKHYSE